MAERLGNTPAVCRKCYVHPAVLDAYLEGSTLAALQRRGAAAAKDLSGLDPEEAAVLTLLRSRMAREAEGRKAG